MKFNKDIKMETRKLTIVKTAPTEAQVSEIVGGSLDTDTANDSICRITYDGHRGTGALISSDYILTAYHVARELERSKDVNIVFDYGTKKEIRRSFSKVIKCLSDKKVTKDDLAIIKLSSPVFSLKPIELDFSNKSAPFKATVYGYGQTHHSIYADENRRKAQVNITYSAGGLYKANFKGSNLQGTCSGDSGGPLIVNNKIIGTVQGGSSNCNDVMTFVNVSYYSKFIKGLIGGKKSFVAPSKSLIIAETSDKIDDNDFTKKLTYSSLGVAALIIAWRISK